MIVTHDQQGKLPFDLQAPVVQFLHRQQHTMFNETLQRPLRRQQRRNASNRQKTETGNPPPKPMTDTKSQKHCFDCGEPYQLLSQHKRQCPGNGHQCSTCGFKGHLEVVCERFKTQRIAAKRERRKRDSRYKTRRNTVSTGNEQTGKDETYCINVHNDPQDLYAIHTVEETFVTLTVEGVTGRYNPYTAGIDSCSSACILNSKHYFETMNETNTGPIHLLNSETNYSGSGVARISISPYRDVFRIFAYYVPEARLNILSLSMLHKAGIEHKLTETERYLQLSQGRKIPIDINNDIYTVQLIPPKPVFTALIERQPTEIDLWHQRTMHVSLTKLQKLGLIKTIPEKCVCNICLQCKQKFDPLRLDASRKAVADKPGEIVAFDLMIPAKHHTGAMLLGIDAYSRLTAGEYVANTSAGSLQRAFLDILHELQVQPRLVILDRQPGFYAQSFKDMMKGKGITYRFVPPERHGEFNGLIERTIEPLRTMARCALRQAELSTHQFWSYATFHAINVKNHLPHAGIQGDIPIERHFKTKSSIEHFKTFGSVAYKLIPLRNRKDKFAPTGTPVLFLGYSKFSSYQTAIVYNPRTKKISFVSQQDLYFNEMMTYNRLIHDGTPPELSVSPQLDLGKQTKFICEDSDTTDDDTLETPSRDASDSTKATFPVDKSSTHQEVTEVHDTDNNGNFTSSVIGEAEPHSGCTVDSDTINNRTHQVENRALEEPVIVDRHSSAQDRVTQPQTNVNSGISQQEQETQEDSRYYVRPTVQEYTNSYGRVVRLPKRFEREGHNSNMETHAIVTTTQSVVHTTKPRTQGQKDRLRKKIIEARFKQQPATFKDLYLAPDRDEYLRAIDKELSVMKTRKVLITVARNTIPNGSEVGKLVLLLTRKRDGRYKARLVYNGRAQRIKLTTYHGSPTLDSESLCTALTLAAKRNYKFCSLDITSAFLYADLPDDVILLTEIPEGHSDCDRRSTHVLQIKKNLYGLKERPKL